MLYIGHTEYILHPLEEQYTRHNHRPQKVV